eukprot:522691_1
MISLFIAVSCLFYVVPAASDKVECERRQLIHPMLPIEVTYFREGKSYVIQDNCVDGDAKAWSGREYTCQSDTTWVESVYQSTCKGKEECVVMQTGDGAKTMCYSFSDASPFMDFHPVNNDNSSWFQYMVLNCFVSAVTSLCVVALCLTSYYCVVNQTQKRNSLIKWQGVCNDDDMDV